ncbi:MAG: hypothetical protein L0I24_09745 [Pseudonocardia sp.]|nr:hypothetical protein [Pseudonocardia sp.]
MSVDRRAPDECWPWTGYSEDGYGRFLLDGRMIGAHELAVSFTTGERRLPELETCHSCNNPPCCNPAHLRFDTRQGNVDDMVRSGRNHKFPRRLDDATVRLIRERRAAGACQDDLAARYGVSASYISYLVTGLKRLDAGGPIDTTRQYRRKSA